MKKHISRKAVDLILLGAIMVIYAFAIPARNQILYYKPPEIPVNLDNLQNISPDIFLRHGDKYILGGNYEDAVLYYEKALQGMPSDSDIYYNLGVASFKMGKLEKAIKENENAARLQPLDAGIHYNLGVTYGEAGMWQKAIREYRKVIKIDSSYPKAYYNLGIAYGKTGKWNNALNIYRKLISLEPDNMDAHYNLALVGIILNNKKMAVREYKILQRRAPELANKIAETIA